MSTSSLCIILRVDSNRFCSLPVYIIVLGSLPTTPHLFFHENMQERRYHQCKVPPDISAVRVITFLVPCLRSVTYSNKKVHHHAWVNDKPKRSNIDHPDPPSRNSILSFGKFYIPFFKRLEYFSLPIISIGELGCGPRISTKDSELECARLASSDMRGARAKAMRSYHWRTRLASKRQSGQVVSAMDGRFGYSNTSMEMSVNGS